MGQLHAGSSYLQVLVNLVLLGAGVGIALVSLTSASLAGVDPMDAGAASGLVNVVQQLGAALGLAVLVTIFGAVTRHAQLSNALGSGAGPHADAVLVHGLDIAFAVGAGFAITAMAMVVLLVHPVGAARPAPVAVRAAEERPEVDLRALEGALQTVDAGAVEAGAWEAGAVEAGEAVMLSAAGQALSSLADQLEA